MNQKNTNSKVQSFYEILVIVPIHLEGERKKINKPVHLVVNNAHKQFPHISALQLSELERDYLFKSILIL